MHAARCVGEFVAYVNVFNCRGPPSRVTVSSKDWSARTKHKPSIRKPKRGTVVHYILDTVFVVLVAFAKCLCSRQSTQTYQSAVILDAMNSVWCMYALPNIFIRCDNILSCNAESSNIWSTECSPYHIHLEQCSAQRIHELHGAANETTAQHGNVLMYITRNATIWCVLCTEWCAACSMQYTI
jgi:hypothetical protein